MKKRYLLFRLANRPIAVPLAQIEEVVHNFQIVDIPRAPENLLGTINLRGQIISIYDLANGLAGEKTQLQPLKSCVVIFNIDNNQFGIVVEEAIGVSALEESKPLDQSLVDQFRGLINEAFNYDSELLFKLNEDQLADFLGYAA